MELTGGVQSHAVDAHSIDAAEEYLKGAGALDLAVDGHSTGVDHLPGGARAHLQRARQ